MAPKVSALGQGRAAIGNTRAGHCRRGPGVGFIRILQITINYNFQNQNLAVGSTGNRTGTSHVGIPIGQTDVQLGPELKQG